ncbi:MAG TPA: trypsin-like peptidase domain-containing protein [Methylomirabilota bacterium]
MQRSILLVALVSAVIGAGAAIGIVDGLGVGGGGTSTTVVQQAPLAAPSESGNRDGGLTARDIYKRDAPGVVFIRAQIVQRTQSPFDFGLPQEQQGEATGSGFVIDRDGTILTNAHVVDGARSVTVQFANRQRLDAKVLGKDESTDLALLKVDPAGLKLAPLTLGSSKGVQVGDPAVAIGNPFGLERTLTTGVISAVQRTLRAPNNFRIDDAIQTDAPINPGNSGGPLIDATGKVIGINSQIETGGSGNGSVGIGFAVPIDTAKKIIPALKKSGRVDRGYLGVSTRAIDKSLAGLNLPAGHGALVQSVTPGSPAAKAGIRAGDITAQLDGEAIQLGGDIITAVDGKSIRSDDDLTAAIAGRKKGDKVSVTVVRGGKEKTVEVTLGDRPASADVPDQAAP